MTFIVYTICPLLHHIPVHNIYTYIELLLSESLKIQEKEIGQGDLEIIPFMINLAIHYRIHSKKYKESELLYLHCLSLIVNKYGSTHIQAIMYKNNLANLASDQHNYDHAEVLYNECIYDNTMKFGETHISTLQYKFNLGMLYCDMYIHGGYRGPAPTTNSAAASALLIAPPTAGVVGRDSSSSERVSEGYLKRGLRLMDECITVGNELYSTHAELAKWKVTRELMAKQDKRRLLPGCRGSGSGRDNGCGCIVS